MRQMRDYLDAQVTDWLQAHGGYHFCGFYSLDKAAFLTTGTFAPARAAPCDGTHGAGQIRAA